MRRDRHPAGTPVGGRFAPGARAAAAASVALVPDHEGGTDPRLTAVRAQMDQARPERSPEYVRLVAASCALELRDRVPDAATVHFRTEDYFQDRTGFEVVPLAVRDADGNDLGPDALQTVRELVLPRRGALGWDQLEEDDHAWDVQAAVDAHLARAAAA